MAKIRKIFFSFSLLLSGAAVNAGEINEVIVFNNTPNSFWFRSSISDLGTYVAPHGKRIMYFLAEGTKRYQITYTVSSNNTMYCDIMMDYKKHPALSVKVSGVIGTVPYTCKLADETDQNYPVVLVTAK